jgi:serine protease Do
VAQTSPGTTVPVTVLRDGKKKTMQVTVKELPGAEHASVERGGGAIDSGEALVGVGVSDIDAAARQRFGLPANVNGAVVIQVDPNSAAFEAGLREGEVIQEINRKAVKSAEDAVELTQNVEDKRTLLRVWSKGGSRYLVVDENKG